MLLDLRPPHTFINLAAGQTHVEGIHSGKKVSTVRATGCKGMSKLANNAIHKKEKQLFRQILLPTGLGNA